MSVLYILYEISYALYHATRFVKFLLCKKQSSCVGVSAIELKKCPPDHKSVEFLMSKALDALDRLCTTKLKERGSDRIDTSDLVREWVLQLPPDDRNDPQTVSDVYRLTRRLITELQPFMLQDLERWTWNIDAWLQMHLTLMSACEFTTDVYNEISYFVDEFSASCTRHALHRMCIAVENALPSMEHSLAMKELQLSKASPLEIVEQELLRRRTKILETMVQALNHELSVVNEVLLLVNTNTTLSERVVTFASSPKMMHTVYTFLQYPKDGFLEACASSDDPQRWFATFGTCCLGEIAGAPRLRGAAIPAACTWDTKRAVLRDWLVSHQDEVERACLALQSKIKSHIVSLSAYLDEYDPRRAISAEMLDRWPRLGAQTHWGSVPVQRTRTWFSPYGASIRMLRLLQSLQRPACARQLEQVSVALVHSLVHRIATELLLASGTTSNVIANSLTSSTTDLVENASSSSTRSTDQSTPPTPPTNDLSHASLNSTIEGTTLANNEPSKPKAVAKQELCTVFLETLQTCVGKEGEVVFIDGTPTTTRLLSFEDLALEMKQPVGMSTSQRLVRLVDRLLKNCANEVREGHIRYVRAIDVRKRAGVGRCGRKVHNHLVVTEYGLHRCHSIANELLLLQQADPEAFLKRWTSS